MPNPHADNPDVLALFKAQARLSAAELVADVLARSGLTRKQFAERVGMDSAALSRLLRGRVNVTVATLAGILNAFDLRLHFGTAQPDVLNTPTPPPEPPDAWLDDYLFAA